MNGGCQDAPPRLRDRQLTGWSFLLAADEVLVRRPRCGHVADQATGRSPVRLRERSGPDHEIRRWRMLTGRLPVWMKSARNRNNVLRTVGRFRAARYRRGR